MVETYTSIVKIYNSMGKSEMSTVLFFILINGGLKMIRLLSNILEKIIIGLGGLLFLSIFLILVVLITSEILTMF